MDNQEVEITAWEPIIKGFKTGLPHTLDYTKQFGPLLLAEIFIFAVHPQLSHITHSPVIFKILSSVFDFGELLFAIYLAYRIDLWGGDIYWKNKLPLFSSTAPNFVRYLKFWFRYNSVFILQCLGLLIVGIIAFSTFKQISLYVTTPIAISFLLIRVTNLTLLSYLFLKEGDAKAARKKIDPLFHREFWSNSPILWGYVSFGVVSGAVFMGITSLFGTGFPLFDPHYHYDLITTLFQKLLSIALSVFITPGLQLSYWEYLRIMEEKYPEESVALDND